MESHLKVLFVAADSGFYRIKRYPLAGSLDRRDGFTTHVDLAQIVVAEADRGTVLQIRGQVGVHAHGRHRHPVGRDVVR
jgi:hypothetical protein